MSFKQVILSIIAAAFALLLIAAGFLFFGMRAADERLANAFVRYETEGASDKAERKRLTAIEKTCHESAVKNSPASERLSDTSATLTPGEIQSYSALYSSCLADDFLTAKNPLLEQAGIYYSAALPARFFQTQMAPNNPSFDLLLPKIYQKQDEAFARQLKRAQSFRALSDEACSGYWGIRACSIAMAGLPAKSMRERKVIELIAQREEVEKFAWQMQHPKEAMEYQRLSEAAEQKNQPAPLAPWRNALDALEEKLKQQVK